MPPPTAGRKAAAIAIVAVLGVVVAVLCGIALTRPSAATGSGAEPLPALTQTTSAPPTPTPTALLANRADERFLSFAGDSGWRATAGSCEGAAPLLQRTNEQGEWVDVVPREYQLRQIASLDAYSDVAELVGGVNDACAPASLRTFSAGAAWESYDDALARSRYLDFANPGIAHTRSGEITAPCANATSLRAWGDLVAVICDGQAWLQTNDSWTALETLNVKALAIDDTDLIIGHQSADCAGLALTRISGDESTSISCAENVDAAQPIAVASADDGVIVWAADDVIRVVD